MVSKTRKKGSSIKKGSKGINYNRPEDHITIEGIRKKRGELDIIRDDGQRYEIDIDKFIPDADKKAIEKAKKDRIKRDIENKKHMEKSEKEWEKRVKKSGLKVGDKVIEKDHPYDEQKIRDIDFLTVWLDEIGISGIEGLIKVSDEKAVEKAREKYDREKSKDDLELAKKKVLKSDEDFYYLEIQGLEAGYVKARSEKEAIKKRIAETELDVLPNDDGTYDLEWLEVPLYTGVEAKSEKDAIKKGMDLLKNNWIEATKVKKNEVEFDYLIE